MCEKIKLPMKLVCTIHLHLTGTNDRPLGLYLCPGLGKMLSKSEQTVSSLPP